MNLLFTSHLLGAKNCCRQPMITVLHALTKETRRKAQLYLFALANR